MSNLLLMKSAHKGLVRSGLVAEYRFNEGSGQKLNDYSGNNYHGQLGSTEFPDINDPVWITEGVQFDGVDDYISLPITLSPESFITIELVANPSQEGQALFRAAYNSYSFVRIDDDRVLVRSTVNDSSIYISYSKLPSGMWSYVAVCIDYVNTKIYIYINGVLDTIGDISGLSQNYIGELSLVGFNDPTYPKKCSLAYGIVRKRVILQSAQIKQNYNYLKSKLFVERRIMLP